MYGLPDEEKQVDSTSMYNVYVIVLLEYIYHGTQFLICVKLVNDSNSVTLK